MIFLSHRDFTDNVWISGQLLARFRWRLATTSSTRKLSPCQLSLTEWERSKCTPTLSSHPKRIVSTWPSSSWTEPSTTCPTLRPSACPRRTKISSASSAGPPDGVHSKQVWNLAIFSNYFWFFFFSKHILNRKCHTISFFRQRKVRSKLSLRFTFILCECTY